MLHHLTGGRWGYPVRRFLKRDPYHSLDGIAYLSPCLFGCGALPMGSAGRGGCNDVLQHKHLYMNVPGFILRSVIFLGFWIVLVAFPERWSLRQDQTTGCRTNQKLKKNQRAGRCPLPAHRDFCLYRLGYVPGGGLVFDDVSGDHFDRPNPDDHCFRHPVVGLLPKGASDFGGPFPETPASSWEPAARVCHVLDLRLLFTVVDYLVRQFAP